MNQAASAVGITSKTLFRWSKDDANLRATLKQACLDGATARLRPHGTLERYRHWRCRCDACREANAAWHRAQRKKRRTEKDAADFKHGASAYGNWGCRCEICTAAFRKANAPAYERYTASGKRAKTNASRRQKLQAETLDAAHRHGYQWTGPELEIASREDLTGKQIALMTGRTLEAVRTVRTRMKRDPRKAFLAGHIESPYG